MTISFLGADPCRVEVFPCASKVKVTQEEISANLAQILEDGWRLRRFKKTRKMMDPRQNHEISTQMDVSTVVFFCFFCARFKKLGRIPQCFNGFPDST